MKEANLKINILYDFKYMIFWKRQNCGNSKSISGFQGLREVEWMTRWSTEDLGSSETILYDSIMVDIRHCTFGKTHRTTTPGVNPNLKLWTFIDSGINVGSPVVINVPLR